MEPLEILLSATVRFTGTLVLHGSPEDFHYEVLNGVASFATFDQANLFASAIEEGFDVDDPIPYKCPDHEDETGWEVQYVKREE